MPYLKFKISLLFWATILIVACHKEAEVKPVPPITTPENTVDTILPTGNERCLTKGSEYFFDQTQLNTFEINLPAFLITIH